MDAKGLLKSKTFWSDVLTISVGVAQLVDTYFGTHIMSSQLTGLLLGVAGMLGIYGRKTADRKIEGLI